MKRSTFTVAKKLYSGFIAILFILVVLGVTAIVNMGKINDNTTEIADVWLPGVQAINNINYLTEHIVALEYKYLIEQEADDLKVIEESMNKTFSAIDVTFAEYEKTIFLEEDRKNFDALEEKWESYKGIHNHFIELGATIDVVRGLNNEELATLKSYTNDADALFSDMQTNLDNLVQLNKDQALRVNSEGDQLFNQSFIIIVVILVGGIILGLAVAFVVSRTISRPLELVTENVQQVADGNLMIEKIQIKNNDEIGQLATSFNQMTENLRTIIQEVSSTSEQVATSSEELLASSEQTSSATNQVVLSIQEVANTIEIQGKNTEESAVVVKLQLV